MTSNFYHIAPWTVPWHWADGGVRLAGDACLPPTTRIGNCAARALSIVTGRPYQDVHEELLWFIERNHLAPNHPTFGISWVVMIEYMHKLGWHTIIYPPGMVVLLSEVCEGFGGRILVVLSSHLLALMSGEVHDTQRWSGGQRVLGLFLPPRIPVISPHQQTNTITLQQTNNVWKVPKRKFSPGEKFPVGVSNFDPPGSTTPPGVIVE